MSTFQPTLGSLQQAYFVNRFRTVFEERKQRLAALKTREDALAYVADVRRKVQSIFSFPAEKTPLNAVITGTLKGEGFRIEKVIYYSRPSFPVTANLYIPDNLDKPAPCVLFLCGHSQNGKAHTVYQQACQGLVRQGYVVLSVDPISQGERYQFLNEPNTSSVGGACTREHNMLGKQMFLNGDFFGSWRAWDAIRGLDYLLGRPEADTARVGVTGTSGGGTMTSLVNAADDRFTMAAPSCYITSWRRNVENELPADVEQIPPGLSGMGCEMGDLLLARAPRPLLILGEKDDFFDPRGTRETYEEVRQVYRLLGAEDKVKVNIGPTSHAYSIHNREKMYEFFNIQSANGGAYHEPAEMALFSDKELQCVPAGQVEYLAGRWMVRDFIRQEADRLAAARTPKTRDELKNLFAERLQTGEAQVPYYRILRAQVIDQVNPKVRIFSRFALEVEPAVPAVLKLMAPDAYYHLPQEKKAVLYIPHLDTVDELPQINFGGDAMVYGLDVRGVGESMPLGCDQGDRYFFAPYTHDYFFACCHMMMGESYLSSKVRDILGTLKLLEENGYEEIHLAGRGQGAIPAALAALIFGKAASVTLFNAPISWDSMLRDSVSLWPQSCMLQGILKETDLPDVYAALGNVKLVDSWDNLFRPQPVL